MKIDDSFWDVVTTNNAEITPMSGKEAIGIRDYSPREGSLTHLKTIPTPSTVSQISIAKFRTTATKIRALVNNASDSITFDNGLYALRWIRTGSFQPNPKSKFVLEHGYLELIRKGEDSDLLLNKVKNEKVVVHTTPSVTKSKPVTKKKTMKINKKVKKVSVFDK